MTAEGGGGQPIVGLTPTNLERYLRDINASDDAVSVMCGKLRTDIRYGYALLVSSLWLVYSMIYFFGLLSYWMWYGSSDHPWFQQEWDRFRVGFAIIGITVFTFVWFCCIPPSIQLTETVMNILCPNVKTWYINKGVVGLQRFSTAFYICKEQWFGSFEF